MFKPELEVPSLELCKKLKSLEYPQNGGGWYWSVDNQGRVFLSFFQKMTNEDIEHDEKINFLKRIKAPTVRELGEFFPSEVTCFRDFKRGFLCEYENKQENIVQSFWEDTEANARAKMLIWLVENGYVRFENERMYKNFKKS